MNFLEAEFPSDLQPGAGKGILSAFQALRFLCDITVPALPGAQCLPGTVWTSAQLCVSITPGRGPHMRSHEAASGNTTDDASPVGTSLQCRGCSGGLGTSRMRSGLMSFDLIIMPSNNKLSLPLSHLIPSLRAFPKNMGGNDGEETLPMSMQNLPKWINEYPCVSTMHKYHA